MRLRYYNRLSLLDKVVDYFVLVEARRTFKGTIKPLFYDLNKEKFSKFSHKIIHIIVDDMNDNPIIEKHEVWRNESHQRNCIMRGINLLNLQLNDLITICDVDEIPDPMILEKIKLKEVSNDSFISKFTMDMYYYNLENKKQRQWDLACIVNFSYIKLNTPQYIRSNNNSNRYPLCGWHISYFGDEFFIQNKIREFSHQELNTKIITDLSNIKNHILQHSDMFNREGEELLYIPLSENNYLPPKIINDSSIVMREPYSTLFC
jgi:beta-1,4-mannosyl-glycoprotein beta-1,4-N-acetylglucosaminyltransferase